MSIRVDEKRGLFTIETRSATYQMQVDEKGFLNHLYYGSKIGQTDMSYLHIDYDRSFSTNPDSAFPERRFSLDVLPQEYTGCGLGDYRISSFGVINPDGSRAAEWRFDSWEIREGKYSIPAQPAVYEEEPKEAQTLVITLKDEVSGLSAQLLYGVFEKKDIITRAVRIINHSDAPVTLTKVLSMCIDFPYGDFDVLSFHGRHAMERMVERTPVRHTVLDVRSRRGASSHQQNPFVILCEERTGEDFGGCYGFMLMYSGGFTAQLEKDQFESTRVVMGIQPENFSWLLNPEEAFDTPEVIMSYSDRGFSALSHQYHRILRHNVCRGKYKLARRPVLLNSWEGCYFDFDDRRIVEMAKNAKDLGVELLVMDDGWFGNRNSDNCGLGDWFVNEEKIRCGLSAMVKEINDLGMKFGLWIEPEMVNEDSELFRKHPDWALQVPGRHPYRGRNQLVLNMSRPDVREYLFDSISAILRSANIEYVKWDVNRNLADTFSDQLPAGQQGETAHRHILGVYELLEKLTGAFPDILFEGCSGGGGRFDAAMLYYHPQIWCSDDTDAIPRLAIHNGTSFGYPISAIGAHVSAVPNHQTGRITPLNARGVVAMHGTFGYELDPATLSEEEKEEIRQQIRFFTDHYDLIQNGLYYRLTQIGKQYFEAWEHVSPDQKEAMVSVVVTDTQPNARLIHLKLKGLNKDASYRMEVRTDIDENILSIPDFPGGMQLKAFLEQEGKLYKGAALMNAGITLPWVMGNYPALQLYFQVIDHERIRVL